MVGAQKEKTLLGPFYLMSHTIQCESVLARQIRMARCSLSRLCCPFLLYNVLLIGKNGYWKKRTNVKASEFILQEHFISTFISMYTGARIMVRLGKGDVPEASNCPLQKKVCQSWHSIRGQMNDF